MFIIIQLIKELLFLGFQKDLLIKSRDNVHGDAMIETGFKYFHILLRIIDLSRESKQHQVSK